MTNVGDQAAVVRELYDLRGERNALRGGGFTDDYHGLLAGMRERGAVHEGTIAENVGAPYHDEITGSDENHWSAYSWNACNAALRDAVTYSSTHFEHLRSTFGFTPVAMDGEEHRRYRTLIRPTFLKADVQWWIERFIQDATSGLIERIATSKSADLNLELCALLPLFTITKSFGLPDGEALRYADLVNGIIDAQSASASSEMFDLLMTVVADRREHPEDDVLSHWLASSYTDRRGQRYTLADEEAASFARTLLIAGMGTTWRQLGILLFALLSEPSLLEAVRTDRELLGRAIDESLRWETNFTIVRRLVTRDTELEGVPIPAGAILEISLSSANRDPARWTNPDEFDPGREPIPHLAFGSGPHTCLGLHVARAEMETAVTTLLERLPKLRLDPDSEAPAIVGFGVRGVGALPVLFD